ncbi:MAG: VPDSG-CTERM sorting domain-containing protein [Verrucomicrobiota bacterium]|nr:VPDSG-CTERM sorting domain-containing protein [Verrucomicrobiota bacterium]
MTTSVALAALFALATVARANIIGGSIDMQGSLNLNPASLGTAVSATFNGPATVTQASGAYGNVRTGALVTFYSFGWNPQTPMPFTLWSFKSGLYSYSFNVDSMTVSQSDTRLIISGLATAYIRGPGSPYSNGGSAASWNLTIDNSPDSQSGFLFQFDDPLKPNLVPDGGATGTLLAIALAGLGLLRRKLSA